MSPRLRYQVPSGLPRPLRSLRTPCYLHGTDPAVWKAVMFATLCGSGAGLWFVGSRILAGRADIAEWLLLAFLIPFIVLALRPATWRTPVSMGADERGLFFVGGEDGWDSVFVPWSEIGPISVERVSTGKGTVNSVVLTIAVGSSYWEPAVQSRFMRHILQPEDPPGFRRLPIGPQGVSAQQIRVNLEALRQRAVEPPT